MKTVTVQIGNTDNKLTQQKWSEFVKRTHYVLNRAGSIHFSGGSPNDAPWQNYCWVLASYSWDDTNEKLSELAREYQQDSIAVTYGDTEFIKST